MESSIQKPLQERLREAEDALERSERLALASQYASAILHEVNNPLEAITNLVYLTKLERTNPEQVLENMLVIEEQVRLLGQVTGQALTFHRQQNELKECDLVNIAEAALKLHADKFARHGTTVTRRYRGPAIAKIRGTEILQVVSNLIINAVDALPRGIGQIWIGVKTSKGTVHIAVADDGPGVAQHIVPQLFGPYVTSKTSGTGLGLWLSKRIVEKHGGSLRFRTTREGKRKGTIFRLSLPAGPSQTPSISVPG